jgi:hypothetical protein
MVDSCDRDAALRGGFFVVMLPGAAVRRPADTRKLNASHTRLTSRGPGALHTSDGALTRTGLLIPLRRELRHLDVGELLLMRNRTVSCWDAADSRPSPVIHRSSAHIPLRWRKVCRSTFGGEQVWLILSISARGEAIDCEVESPLT